MNQVTVVPTHLVRLVRLAWVAALLLIALLTVSLVDSGQLAAGEHRQGQSPCGGFEWGGTPRCR